MSKDKKKQKEPEYNVELIKRIQPHGGISFKDDLYVKTGDGYEACLHIMEYPQEMDDHWLAPLTNIKGTVVTVDISTDDAEEVKKNLNRSMTEQNQRYRSASSYVDEEDAETKFQLMDTLMKEISRMNEVVKIVDTRIFVADRTWIGLEEKIKEIKTKLDNQGYKAYINLNETKDDWMSMNNTYREQQKSREAVEGQSYTSNSLAGGYPFHFSQLEDPRGGYYGYTPTGGNFVWDMFYKTKIRSYYNSLVVGTMGSGKSTLLKIMEEDEGVKGHFLRIFDVADEFVALTEELGGKILKPDGSGKDIQNPLEILHATESEQLNFSRHISRLTTFYKALNPEAESTEVTDFTNLLTEFYESIGLTPIVDGVERQISGLPPTAYPIFSEFLDYLNKCIAEMLQKEYNEAEMVLAKTRLETLYNITGQISYIVKTYGNMFNGHSSINNIMDEQIVVFNISGLKDMATNVFAAQMTSLMALCWDNMVTNGKVMKEKYESGKIRIEDVVDFLILVDESHRWVNTKFEVILDMIITYMREARKYFGGICLASQSIRDYVPEGTSDVALNKLKTLFELTQYKFIMHQDSNATDLLRNVFNGILTESQIRKIPKLEMGDAIVNLSSAQTMEVHIQITEDEKEIFKGGV